MITGRTARRARKTIKRRIAGAGRGGRPARETIRAGCPFTTLEAHNNRAKRLY